jgi:hypothetical protein
MANLAVTSYTVSFNAIVTASSNIFQADTSTVVSTQQPILSEISLNPTRTGIQFLSSPITGSSNIFQADTSTVVSTQQPILSQFALNSDNTVVQFSNQPVAMTTFTVQQANSFTTGGTASATYWVMG